MVKHLKHALGLFSRYSVIQRRHHIFQQHEDAVHQCSKQMQAAARTNSRNNAERDGGDGQNAPTPWVIELAISSPSE